MQNAQPGEGLMVQCNFLENQDEAFASSCLILATPMIRPMSYESKIVLSTLHCRCIQTGSNKNLEHNLPFIKHGTLWTLFRLLLSHSKSVPKPHRAIINEQDT